MTALATRLGALVGAAATYKGISVHMAKALDYNHAMSTARHPYDLGDGQFARGQMSCTDAIFVAASALADGDKILMGEWGTGQRFRSVDFKKTVAFAAPVEQTAAQYFDNNKLGFTGNTTAAFPAFSLWAEDPDDSAFVPILLAAEAETTGVGKEEGRLYPLSALAYGVNRRKRSLLIVARAEGVVPVNSGLFIQTTMTEQHK